MKYLNIFGDDRKIPKLSINVRIKVKTNTAEENKAWNTVFGYIMKKPRTKLEFLTVSTIRSLALDKITLEAIKKNISEEDYIQLQKVENVFNNNLTDDIKAFILAILKIPVNILENICKA
jgi:hypothetical protein